MLAGIRSRLTYANVISTLCLFLLLGGSAYAAFSLPKDSVKSKHIVDGQVKEQDLAADYLGATETAVNSEKVAGVDVCKGVARLPSSAGGVVEQQLCADGAVSIVADCRTHPGGQPTIAQVFAKTTEDNAIVGSTSLGGDLDLRRVRVAAATQLLLGCQQRRASRWKHHSRGSQRRDRVRRPGEPWLDQPSQQRYGR